MKTFFTDIICRQQHIYPNLPLSHICCILILGNVTFQWKCLVICLLALRLWIPGYWRFLESVINSEIPASYKKCHNVCFLSLSCSLTFFWFLCFLTFIMVGTSERICYISGKDVESVQKTISFIIDTVHEKDSPNEHKVSLNDFTVTKAEHLQILYKLRSEYNSSILNWKYFFTPCTY